MTVEEQGHELSEGGPRGKVSVSLLLANGELLVEEKGIPSEQKVANLMQKACAALPDDINGSCISLCSAHGSVLKPSQSLLEAEIHDSILTVVLIDDGEALDIIERHFHDLIMQRNGCLGNPSRLTDKGFQFPSLQAHVEKQGKIEDDSVGDEFYPVPGMYGGFRTRVVKATYGWVLTCFSFCRVCEGAEEDHEITVAGVVRVG
mmetsp:Transcript_93568/g.166468  ORF Transcript_93568/g.166468 Transcript_93568/m.166468 type:complete len:204 (-) Transcript_93568:179-790(-)|eukprot:CAMPEP_0197656798 /NCGR_PEP_ID=MMETSP1338-20131121/43408_1 /TAXON_ID=43686 ORGANISM="Pelagodinium beii, Strain RCC1491" /NCGR_SAMPLE_ID=MMETSP1338 /ASSEMBLY_ACC=CAM_ASM_000754 /LENGTH=203 /DNA_ID=CAMNT_0043232981 /DNA_START=51 /DNA_END=662 /DNA_ORIENTATION=+